MRAHSLEDMVSHGRTRRVPTRHLPSKVAKAPIENEAPLMYLTTIAAREPKSYLVSLGCPPGDVRSATSWQLRPNIVKKRTVQFQAGRELGVALDEKATNPTARDVVSIYKFALSLLYMPCNTSLFFPPPNFENVSHELLSTPKHPTERV